ncbi:MAG TPA: redoxin domain-containing protein [Oligoflexia bacterium]|nr:redoxin domain-containing protein [Oligoflexia bacterium]HMR24203.1 redoxin domain-containing protein [Oligoflexia bacterium]
MSIIKTTFFTIIALCSLSFAANIGQAAPAFSAKGSDGKQYSLETLKGKYVVLEWFNPSCPYVKKHYESKNLPDIQSEAKSNKKYPLVWLSVSSSYQEHPAYFSAAEVKKLQSDFNSNADAFIIDETGEIGKAYGATATPHIFIIDPNGKLIYQGGVDGGKNANSLKHSSIESAEHKYLKDVLFNHIFEGKTINSSLSTTRAIGCSVKYKPEIKS